MELPVVYFVPISVWSEPFLLSHLHLYEAVNPYNEYSLKRFTVAPLPEVRVHHFPIKLRFFSIKTNLSTIKTRRLVKNDMSVAIGANR